MKIKKPVAAIMSSALVLSVLVPTAMALSSSESSTAEFVKQSQASIEDFIDVNKLRSFESANGFGAGV